MQKIIQAPDQKSLEGQIQNRMDEGYCLVPGSIQSVRHDYVDGNRSERDQNKEGDIVDYSYWAIMEIE